MSAFYIVVELRETDGVDRRTTKATAPAAPTEELSATGATELPTTETVHRVPESTRTIVPTASEPAQELASGNAFGLADLGRGNPGQAIALTVEEEQALTKLVEAMQKTVAELDEQLASGEVTDDEYYEGVTEAMQAASELIRAELGDERAEIMAEEMAQYLKDYGEELANRPKTPWPPVE